MKTTTTNFDTEKDKISSPAAEPQYLLEIDTDGGTLHLSDQALTVSGQAYSAKVINWRRSISQLVPGENTIRIGDLNIDLFNFPRLDDDIMPGDELRLYVWFSGLSSADKLLMFKGNVSDDIIWDEETIRIGAQDKGKFFDKQIGQPLSGATYPNADPDDLGKVMPIVYGDIKNHQCLAIAAGAATTLKGDHNSTITTITVTSTAEPIAFPSSGTIIIGAEEITYTGKTPTTFTGCTRGTGSTSATSHSNGDTVLEDIASVKYLAANHVVKAMTNPRILPFGMPLNRAVVIDAGSVTFNLDDSGVATVTLTDLLIIRKAVSVEVTQQPGVNDQPDVSQQPVISSTGSHTHTITGPAQTTIYGNAVDSQADCTDPGNAYDRNFDTTYAEIAFTWADINGHLGLNFDYSSYDGLKIKEAVACVRHYIVVGGDADVYKLRLPGSSYSLLNQTLANSPGSTIMTQKFSVPGLVNETDWSKLNTLRVYYERNTGPGSHATRIYELWWEIKYEPSVDAHAADGVTTQTAIVAGTGATQTKIAETAGTEVQIGGDSVAASLGGVLIVDIEGYEDDNPAHYTDSANALIEEPWDVIHHLIENYSNGAGDSDIDLAGSFQDAEDNLPASYKFAFVITDQISLNRLLARLAIQTYCRFVWEAGVAKLLRIKTSGSPDKSLTVDDLILKNSRLDMRIRRRGLNKIINNLEIKYNLNLTLGRWGSPDAYEGTTSDNDATSIATYGERTRTYLMFAVGDNSSMADDLRDKYLALLKDPRREVIFTTYLINIELERGDLIALTVPQYGLSGVLGEIINTEFLPKARNVDPEFRITALIPM